MRKILLLSFLMIFSTINLAVASSADIAINRLTGENFILEKNNNPQGTIIIKSDLDENFHEEVNILDIASENTKFEIKLGKGKGNTLYYLIQNGNLWHLNTIKKINNKWIKSSQFSGLSGQGNAFSKHKNLETHPGKILFLDLQQNAKNNVVVIEEINNKLVIKETVTSQQIRERIQTLRTNGQLESYVELNETTPSPLERNLEDEVDYTSGNGAGFAAGAISGLGIAYRRHFANKWGVQITGIALGDPRNFIANLGVNVMRTLSKKNKTRFYVIMGVAGYYTGSSNTYYSDYCEDWDQNCTTDPNAESDWDHDPFLNIGVGLGIEWNFIDSAHLSFELPIHLLYDGPGDWQVMYIPSVSLIYYF
jgi:hypothetical protein